MYAKNVRVTKMEAQCPHCNAEIVWTECEGPYQYDGDGEKMHFTGTIHTPDVRCVTCEKKFTLPMKFRA